MEHLGFEQRWAVIDLILKIKKQICQIEQYNIVTQKDQLRTVEM